MLSSANPRRAMKFLHQATVLLQLLGFSFSKQVNFVAPEHLVQTQSDAFPFNEADKNITQPTQALHVTKTGRLPSENLGTVLLLTDLVEVSVWTAAEDRSYGDRSRADLPPQRVLTEILVSNSGVTVQAFYDKDAEIILAQFFPFELLIEQLALTSHSSTFQPVSCATLSRNRALQTDAPFVRQKQKAQSELEYVCAGNFKESEGLHLLHFEVSLWIDGSSPATAVLTKRVVRTPLNTSSNEMSSVTVTGMQTQNRNSLVFVASRSSCAFVNLLRDANRYTSSHAREYNRISLSSNRIVGTAALPFSNTVLLATPHTLHAVRHGNSHTFPTRFATGLCENDAVSSVAPVPVEDEDADMLLVLCESGVLQLVRWRVPAPTFSEIMIGMPTSGTHPQDDANGIVWMKFELPHGLLHTKQGLPIVAVSSGRQLRVYQLRSPILHFDARLLFAREFKEPIKCVSVVALSDDETHQLRLVTVFGDGVVHVIRFSVQEYTYSASKQFDVSKRVFYLMSKVIRGPILLLMVLFFLMRLRRTKTEQHMPSWRMNNLFTKRY